MKKDLTAIMVLLDGSGSMTSIKKGVISGFNEFINSQKEVPGKVILSMVQFSTGYYNNYINIPQHTKYPNLDYRTIYHFHTLEEINKLTESNYLPTGGTPLLDAMERAIEEFGADLARMPEKERPSKVVFVTITDGEENSSRSATKENILSMVKHQTDKYNWQFVYLGANQDSFAEAGGIGISKGSTMNFMATDAGMHTAYRSLSASVGSYRTGDTSNVDLSKVDNTVDTTLTVPIAPPTKAKKSVKRGVVASK